MKVQTKENWSGTPTGKIFLQKYDRSVKANCFLEMMRNLKSTVFTNTTREPMKSVA